ncbi:MAG: hypothetical protein LUC24_07095 [Bacteroidales bacterium]|nr:hypothetical protein [Bacteroidales bacterium]
MRLRLTNGNVPTGVVPTRRMPRLRMSAAVLAVSAMLLLPAGCDVHEYPEIPESVTLCLRLSYETDMTVWNHVYDEGTVTETGLGETYDNGLDEGVMRYVIRAYPLTDTRGSAREYTQEFVLTKDLSESPQSLGVAYDSFVTVDLAPGDYSIMVWSDIVRDAGDERFYDEEDFSDVALQGEYRGDSDYRDAFSGTETVTLVTDMVEHARDTVEIAMRRPLAKYELVATDLTEFIVEEMARAAAKSSAMPDGREEPASINVEDYRAVFYYVGFMPSAYSLFTDEAVDSTTGVLFESVPTDAGNGEVSVGFDYVFVNEGVSAVTVQVGLYDGDGEQVSMTGAITVPLERSRHTVIRGAFLTEKATGGVSIDHNYDGEYNLIIP